MQLARPLLAGGQARKGSLAEGVADSRIEFPANAVEAVAQEVSTTAKTIDAIAPTLRGDITV
jgi:hypothetical protein